MITSQDIVNTINHYCFTNIWNEPHKEYKSTFKPFMVGSRSYSGFGYFGGRPLSLPTNNHSYFLYRFTVESTMGLLKLTTNKWLNAVDICNDNDIMMHVFTEKGLMAHKSSCYIYISSGSNCITLAVEKQMLMKISNSRSIYVTTMLDTTANTNTTISTSVANANYLINNKDPVTLMAFLNGYNYDPQVAKSLYTEGDHFEVIYDNDIIGEFDIPITEDPHTFYSTANLLYKDIIHIPKELNPDNAIITYNSCSFFSRTSAHKGCYIHHATDKTTGQITHNDLSIPRYIVDAHQDYLDVNDIYLHVKVRTYDKGNFNIRDSAYIDILYSLSDEEIVSHLMGDISPDLTFWKASELEQHKYVEMMFDTPSIITTEDLTEYTSALGYYHIASILSQRIVTTQMSDAHDNRVTMTKPYIWRTTDCYPIVYRNGSKILNEYVSYINNSNGSITISVSDNVIFHAGDTLTTYFFPLGNRSVHMVSPTDDDSSITIASGSLRIYEQITSIPIKGMYTESNFGYIDVTDTEGIIPVVNSNNTTTISFHEEQYGKTFFIMYDDTTHYKKFEVGDLINDNKNIVVDLSLPVNGSDEYVPMLNVNDVNVYFNGRYLTKDVDYQFVKVDGYSGDTGLVQISISNFQYGLPEAEDNVIEVIATSISVADIDHGFLTNDIISKETDIDIWFDGLSILHIDGKYEHDVVSKGIGLEVPIDKYRNGSIFELKNSVPVEIKQLLMPDTSAEDISRITTIENYLYQNFSIPDEDVIIPESHTTYSPYLNHLLHAIINEETIISYDPVIEHMIDQLLPFEYLKKYDPIFNDPSTLDMRFIDIRPSYLQIVADSKYYNLFRALTTLILPPDPITSGVTENE